MCRTRPNSFFAFGSNSLSAHVGKTLVSSFAFGSDSTTVFTLDLTKELRPLDPLSAKMRALIFAGICFWQLHAFPSFAVCPHQSLEKQMTLFLRMEQSP